MHAFDLLAQPLQWAPLPPVVQSVPQT